MTPNASRGFTLIEVLVTVTLVAILSLIGWRGLDVIERTTERVFGHADDTLMLIRVVGQMEHDIRQHAGIDVLPPPVDTSSGQGTATASRSAALPPGIVANKQELLLVRAAGEGKWQQVSWRLQQGALHRAVGPVATTLPLPEPARSEVVLNQVDAFEIRAWLPGRGWTAAPLPAGPSASGLELVFSRAGTGGRAPYRKVVLLP